MKYDINNLPDKVKVVKENDFYKVGEVLVLPGNLEPITDLGMSNVAIYLGLEAGILEPYDEEEEEQEKLREEIIAKITSDENTELDWKESIKKVLKNYKITKI